MSEQAGTAARLRAWLALFSHSTAWVALFVIFVVLTIGTFTRYSLMNDPAFAAGTMPNWYFFALSIAQFACWALVFLYASRKLGGDHPHSALPTWLALLALYYLLSIWLFVSAQPLLTQLLGGGPTLVELFRRFGVGVIWHVALLPLPVWLVAAAHGAGEPGPGAIRDYMTSKGVGLFVLLLPIQLASAVMSYFALELQGLAVTRFEVLLMELFNALRSTALMLFYIMAYREIRRAIAEPVARN